MSTQPLENASDMTGVPHSIAQPSSYQKRARCRADIADSARASGWCPKTNLFRADRARRPGPQPI